MLGIDNKIMIGLIIGIGFLLSCVFILGGFYSCHAGNGTLTGLKCVGYDEIGVCEFEGQKYKLPEGYNNNSLLVGQDV